jgi:hypothetical protein
LPSFENLDVCRTSGVLGDCQNVVASATQLVDDARIAALVGQEPHAIESDGSPRRADFQAFDVGDLVGGEGYGSPYVLPRQVRIRSEEILLRSSFADPAQNELDSDPRASDDGLAEHDLGPHLDSVGKSHGQPPHRF